MIVYTKYFRVSIFFTRGLHSFFPRNLPGHACCFFEAQSTSEQKWLEVRAQNNYRNQNSVLLLMM